MTVMFDTECPPLLKVLRYRGRVSPQVCDVTPMTIDCSMYGVVDSMQPLHARINGHRSDIAHRRTDVSPVPEHFNRGEHSVLDMTVMVIELSTSRDHVYER